MPRDAWQVPYAPHFVRSRACAGFLFAPRDRPTRRARECGSGEQLDYDDGTVRRPLSFASAESSGSWYAIMLANLPSAPIR